jgi:hypothetical protein
VWCHPRRRSEAARNPRAQSEAGTRRSWARWHQPTEISRVNRRMSLLQLFPGTKEDNHHADLEKAQPTLDIGNHSNGGR